MQAWYSKEHDYLFDYFKALDCLEYYFTAKDAINSASHLIKLELSASSGPKLNSDEEGCYCVYLLRINH